MHESPTENRLGELGSLYKYYYYYYYYYYYHYYYYYANEAPFIYREIFPGSPSQPEST